MSKNKVSIYLCTPMTGINCDELWIKSIHDRQIYEKEGITVISPVDGEGIPFAPVKLTDRGDTEMMRVWKHKDKRAIKDTNVLVYENPNRWSQGVAHEIVLSRGVLWKPTVYIGTAGFITREEDDYVAASHTEAAMIIKARWGTRTKRVIWRLKMLNSKLPKWIWDQIMEFK